MKTIDRKKFRMRGNKIDGFILYYSNVPIFASKSTAILADLKLECIKHPDYLIDLLNNG